MAVVCSQCAGLYLISAFIYLRYQAPVYNVDAAVLIKEGDKKGGSSNNPMGALQDLGMFSMTNNFDNEVEILKSRTLIKNGGESFEFVYFSGRGTYVRL